MLFISPLGRIHRERILCIDTSGFTLGISYKKMHSLRILPKGGIRNTYIICICIGHVHTYVCMHACIISSVELKLYVERFTVTHTPLISPIVATNIFGNIHTYTYTCIITCVHTSAVHIITYNNIMYVHVLYTYINHVINMCIHTHVYRLNL